MKQWMAFLLVVMLTVMNTVTAWAAVKDAGSSWWRPAAKNFGSVASISEAVIPLRVSLLQRNHLNKSLCQGRQAGALADDIAALQMNGVLQLNLL